MVSRPDDIKGEVPVAFVLLKAGAQPSEELKKELIKTVDKYIGPTARPAEIYFAEDVPKTRSGKIMRRILKALVRGEPFGPMPILLALADEVVKLSAVCTVCGAPATRSQRLVDGKPATAGPEILIGGLESYEPRCRDHFLPP